MKNKYYNMFPGIENNYYSMFPGIKNGESVWFIEYDDGTQDTIPFDSGNITKKLELKIHQYKLKKRLEKINKILNGK